MMPVMVAANPNMPANVAAMVAMMMDGGDRGFRRRDRRRRREPGRRRQGWRSRLLRSSGPVDLDSLNRSHARGEQGKENVDVGTHLSTSWKVVPDLHKIEAVCEDSKLGARRGVCTPGWAQSWPPRRFFQSRDGFLKLPDVIPESGSAFTL